MTGSQRKVAKWEMYMIGKFLFIPAGLIFGFGAKFFRIFVRYIFGR